VPAVARSGLEFDALVSAGLRHSASPPGTSAIDGSFLDATSHPALYGLSGHSAAPINQERLSSAARARRHTMMPALAAPRTGAPP
jgi:hypothetical protein